MAARYLELVAAAAPAIEAKLHERVLANRVASVAPDGSTFALRPWRLERRRYVARVRALAAPAPAILVTDVRHCYASIRPAVVERRLLEADVARPVATAIAALLRRFGRLEIEGLPVGPEPSAVLANAVLSVVDDRLVGAGLEHVRWVDDVIVALPRPADAGLAVAAIDAALGSVGLTRHVGKTRVIAPPAAELVVSPSVRRADGRGRGREVRLG